jgi:hypothetical protein
LYLEYCGSFELILGKPVMLGSGIWVIWASCVEQGALLPTLSEKDSSRLAYLCELQYLELCQPKNCYTRKVEKGLEKKISATMRRSSSDGRLVTLNCLSWTAISKLDSKAEPIAQRKYSIIQGEARPGPWES